MSNIPTPKRKYHTFLSHAHVDKAIVDQLDHWLNEAAGIPVWYDSRNLPAGTTIVNYLAEAITQCRSLILVLSKTSVTKGWVDEEYNVALAERTQSRDFHIIPIRIEDCEPPGFLRTTKWFDLFGGTIDLTVADQLLTALYYEDAPPDLEATRDVYVSRSWRGSEAHLADSVCEALDRAGFRLIGDAPDQRDWHADRVKSIIASCGGLIGILPNRGQGTTSKYILQEIQMAHELHLPCLVVGEGGVQQPKELAQPVVLFPVDQAMTEDSHTLLRNLIEDLQEAWQPPVQPRYVFFATDLGEEHRARNRVIRSMLERITAMPCLMGEDIREGQLQQVITDRIAHAFLVIADISADNLNTCIEAGIARGARRSLHLVAQGQRHTPTPFMFRDQQVWYFDTDAELLGRIHRIAYPYRRRILNSELPDKRHL